MTFAQATASCFSKYVTFSGRAPRSEFWWFLLFVWLGTIVIGVLESIIVGVGGGVPIMGGIFTLAMILPQISVVVRRLHDGDRSGWFYWIGLVPLIGIIILIVWMASKGTDGDNRFGPDPLNGEGGGSAPDDGDYDNSAIPTVRK